jgi:predicted ester cyclase
MTELIGDNFRSRIMATMLTLEQMKQFVRDHFEDFVNKRNAAVIRKNMTSDFHDHDGPGGKPTGADSDEQMMLNMYKAMPDLHLTIEDMVAEGDKVVCRNIWRWTDTASGKKMQFHGFVLWRFEGDKIAERWATVTPPAEGTSWTAPQIGKQAEKPASGH